MTQKNNVNDLIMIKYDQEVNIHNQKILSRIKLLTSEKYLKIILEFLKENSCVGKLFLVNKSEINSFCKQNENWDVFDHYYINEYMCGGYEGDWFTGYIYVPIKDDIYLKSFYDM